MQGLGILVLLLLLVLLVLGPLLSEEVQNALNALPEEFRAVIESDYAKYGKLRDLFLRAHLEVDVSARGDAVALTQLVASGDAFECRCSRSDLAATGGLHHGCVARPSARAPAWPPLG